MNSIDITKMSVIELKALAYEQFKLRDLASQNISTIENEIERKENEKKEMDNG